MFAEENGLKGDPRLQHISQSIRVVPHFPKNGFLFFLFIFYLILYGNNKPCLLHAVSI